MLRFPIWKIIIILLPCLWGVYSFSPHFFYSQVEKYNDFKKTENFTTDNQPQEKLLWYDWAPSNLVNLGLDLRGGAHVLVEVNLEDVYSSIDNLFKNNKYLEYGKEAKNMSTNFLWDNIIEKYKRIL